MYGIALTVAACLQAGTRADVAWLIDVEGMAVPDWSDAVVITPGGGRIGSLLGGALDGALSDLAGRLGTGRLVDVEVSAVDALIAGLESSGRARCVLAPADTLPVETWELAAARQRFTLTLELDDDEVSSSTVSPGGSGAPGSTFDGSRLVSVFAAAPQLLVVGGGPIAEALVALGGFLGWQTRLSTDPTEAGGVIATLSENDKVVVAAHDLELAGAALVAALGSRCGYIGSVGSRRMQTDRADWLAYRGVTDLSRVRGPAGLDIGADTPEEVAVAIVAETIAGRMD